jgi:hypothetical protein
LFAFEEPIEVFPALTDADPQQGIPEAVIVIFRLTFEPVPASARVRQLTEISSGPSVCLGGEASAICGGVPVACCGEPDDEASPVGAARWAESGTSVTDRVC